MTNIFNHHNHQWFWCFCCFLYTPFYGREATPSKWFVQEVGLDCKIHWFFSSWSWAKSCHQRVNKSCRWMCMLYRNMHAYIYIWYPPWYLPFNFSWYSRGLVTDLHGWSLFIYIYVQREDRKVRNLAKYSENIIYNILDMFFGILLGVFPWSGWFYYPYNHH